VSMTENDSRNLIDFPVPTRDVLCSDGEYARCFRGPFVHFAGLACLETRLKRSRSCPAITSALTQGVWRNGRKRAYPDVRGLLGELGIQELSYVARHIGLPKLSCYEDRQLALQMLPSGSDLQSKRKDDIIRFYETLSWNELIRSIGELANKRLQDSDTTKGRAKRSSWEYLSKVCELLLQSQLRDQDSGRMPSIDGTLTLWRMNRICKLNGLSSWWEVVVSRFGRGNTAVLVARQAPWVLDEVREVSRLVPACRLLPKLSCVSSCDLKCYLEGCDVLYIAGKYDNILSRLQAHVSIDIELAILNVCRSQTLAMHLLAAGVRHVVCWPADVHDRVAFDFGVSFVRFLFESSIEEAFARAKLCVSASERPPRLLDVVMRDKPPRFDRDTLEAKVVLERRGHQASIRRLDPCVGTLASVLHHTALNGWVKVVLQSGKLISWRQGHWSVLTRGRRDASSPRKKIRRSFGRESLFEDSLASGVLNGEATRVLFSRSIVQKLRSMPWGSCARLQVRSTLRRSFGREFLGDVATE